MTTFFYSVLHFLVDGICAAAMFSRFLGGSRGYLWILAYNFCAFVLQMPFGALLDGWNDSGGSERKAFAFAFAGVVLTIAGAFTSPAVLGIGNALFHVGGGVGTILEDRACASAGRRLGVFVAPGAMGLFLGKIAAQGGSFGTILNEGTALNAGMLWVIGSAAVAFIMIAALRRALARSETVGEKLERASQERGSDSVLESIPSRTPDMQFLPQSREMLIIAGCFCVVVLRSCVGMAVSMPWRTTVAAGFAATAAVVLGKIAGGFLAASLGRKRTVLWSLLAAAFCYAFCQNIAPGILALLFFNMTMPVTLQILVDRYRSLPGTMFGLLTVGLFVGFLPVYFSAGATAPGGAIGAVLSLVSLAMLWAVSGGSPECQSGPLRESSPMSME